MTPNIYDVTTYEKHNPELDGKEHPTRKAYEPLEPSLLEPSLAADSSLY